MTAKQFRAAIARLGLTQVNAALLVGATGRSARRWIAGDAPIPDAVAIVLRLLLDGKISVRDVEQARKE